jgi:hypothetical protein
MSEPEQQSPDFQASTPMAPDKTGRTLGMLCHLLALCMFTCIPFANIIGPLVLWLIKKDDYPFVDDQGKESINFQITMSLAAIACFILSLAGIGIFLGLALLAVNLVFIIIATIKANNGEAYRYPFCLRLIK